MMRKLMALLALAGPLSAAAFYDHFEGDSLGPHWKRQNWPHGGGMNYQVAESLLTVTGLDGSPDGATSAGRSAGVGQYEDFDLTVIVGWGAGSAGWMNVAVGTGPDDDGFLTWGVAGILLDRWNGTFSLGLRDVGSTILPVPSPGMHEFHVIRRGQSGRAYWDGELVIAGENMTALPVEAVAMSFQGPNDGVGFAPYYVDLIEVVPEPATTVGLVFGIALMVACIQNRR